MHELSQNHIVEYVECSDCEKKAAWISLISNLILAFFKAVVGFISGSKAILADSLYSFKDFVTSLVVLIGLKFSVKPADENHPYGHGKIEFIAVFLISIFIIVAAIFLFIHSIKDVWITFHGRIKAPKFIAFWAAIISIVANYKLSGYLHCVAERLRSPAMLANAKHNHSDAISSGFVAVAILGTRIGFYFLDPLVAVIETIDLIKLSVGMVKDSLKGILDASVDEPVIQHVESIVKLVPGVRRIHSVVARKVGQDMWFDIVIKVEQNLTLEDGDRIGCQVKETLMKKLENIAGVNLSIKPYLP